MISVVFLKNRYYSPFCYLKRYSFSDYFVSLCMDINH